jgi:predicted nucleic acid-binding protein
MVMQGDAGASALAPTQERGSELPGELAESEELPMDLADASLVLLAERLGHGRIVSTDQRDFRTYRWKCHHPFENLLLEDVE